MSGTSVQPYVPAQNPFTQLGQSLQGINALQDFQAKRATADAYGQSIDPTTGAFDQGKFNALMASTPQGRWNIGPSMQQSGQAQTAQGLGTQEQIAAKQAQLAGISGYMTPLFQQTLKGQPVTGQQVLDATNQAAAAGLATPEMVANVQKQVASLNGGDATSLVRGAMFATQTGQQQLAALAPPVTMTQSGSQIIPVQTHPTGTGYVGTGSGSAIPIGLTPDQYATPIQVQDNNKFLPDGKTPNPNYGGSSSVLLGDLLKSKGINPGTLGAPDSTGPNLGTGRINPPPALLNPNKPATTPTPTATPPTTPTPTPNAPAQPTPLTTTRSSGDETLIKEAAPKFQADIDAGTNAQNQQAVLGNILADTAQFNTGPIAGIWGKVRSYGNAIGLPVNVEGQAAKESFNKLASTLANAQGAGSDARMNVNISANPHEELTPAGVDLVTRQLQGNADYIQAKAQLAQQYPNRTDYGGFQTQAAQLDPRVFQLNRMTGPQRQTYLASLDSAAKDQLVAAIKKAKDLGVIGGG